MNFLTRTLDIFTFYETILVVAMVAFFIILTTSYIYLLSADRKIVIISLVSYLINTILFIGIYMLLELVFGTASDGLSQLSLLVTLVISTLNLLVLGSTYKFERFRKGFDIDHVSRTHFDSTLKTSAFLIIIGLSFIPFTPIRLAVVILAGLLPAIVSINFTHLLVRRLLRE